MENRDFETIISPTEEAAAEKKPNKLVTFLKSRKARHGSVATAIVAVAVAIVILVNVVCGMLIERYPSLMIDFTTSKTYQLQDDTKEYIEKLDTPITVYILASKKEFKNGLKASGGSNYFVQAETLLSKIDAMSDNITVKYVDLSENPTFSNKYPDLNWSTTSNNYLMLVDDGENYTALETTECFSYDSQYASYGYQIWTGTTIEQALVTGILDVTTGDKVKVEFLKGSGQDETIYSYLKDLLKKNAYDVSDVSLTTGDLSADSEIAIMYGPTVDLSEEAAKKLENWLTNDGNYGKTLIYLPVDTKVNTPNLDKIISQYGLQVDDSIAFTTSNMHCINNNPFAFLADYPEDRTYVKDLKNTNVPTVVYNCRSINITDENAATALLNITSSAGSIPFDKKVETVKDLKKYLNSDGVTLAAIGKKTNENSVSSNVAVFGSYSMFYDTMITSSTYNNGNYIVNFCNTVTNRGDMGITIASAPADAAELNLFSATPAIVIGVIFIGLVPITVLLIGLIMFFRRRNG